MNKRQDLQVDDELIDEIVDEILKEGVVAKKPDYHKGGKKSSNIFHGDLNKIESIERKLDDHINDYETTIVEIERQITEKSHDSTEDFERQLMHMQGQIEDLRTAMIRLSGEFKKFKESSSR